jgi:hypothetical protein
MSDGIRCTCPSCAAKYRLPDEAQGRTARCKVCGVKFDVPKMSLEDSVLDWLTEGAERDDDIEQPRVINIQRAANPDGASRRRGVIRMRSASEESHAPAAGVPQPQQPKK